MIEIHYILNIQKNVKERDRNGCTINFIFLYQKKIYTKFNNEILSQTLVLNK